MATPHSEPPSTPVSTDESTAVSSAYSSVFPPHAPMGAPDVVLRFLESIGRRSEAEFYFSLFAATDKAQFAMCVLQGSVLREHRDAVVMDVRLLSTLGLVPVLVVAEQPAAVASDLAAALVDALRAQQVPAQIAHDPSRALVADEVVRLVNAGTVPVLPLRALRASLAPELASWVQALGSRKLIFLRRAGGLTRAGVRVPLVNLSAEYEALRHAETVHERDRVLLAQVRHIVNTVPHPLTVSVTSPWDLLKELFTVKGAGTLLRRGSTITSHDDWRTLHPERVRAVVQSAFGARLRDEFLTRPFLKAFVADDYQGIAIVHPSAHGPYLTKFAVERKAQGEGVGRDVWDAMQHDFASLFWRARPRNAVSAWYASVCDGLVRTQPWHVFWRGVALDEVPSLVRWALRQPEDLIADREPQQESTQPKKKGVSHP
jgi:acetylglutamate synthase